MVNTWNTDKDRVGIKDQLGKDPSVTPILIPDFNENLIFEEGPTVIELQDIGNHFTLDHPINGVLDSATLELDTGLGTLSVNKVFNPNNEFREHFRSISDIELDDKNSHKVFTFIDLSNTTATLSEGSVTF